MKTNRTTVTKLQLREEELESIIIKALIKKGVPNVEHHVDLKFTKESFSNQKNGLNAYNENVVNIVVTKREALN